MESNDKPVENDKTLETSENTNGLLLKDLIHCVEEFVSKRNDTTHHLAEIIKRIFFSKLKVLDKNVSKSSN